MNLPVGNTVFYSVQGQRNSYFIQKRAKNWHFSSRKPNSFLYSEGVGNDEKINLVHEACRFY